MNTEKTADKTTLREMPIIVLKGFGMGTADVIPGVSGGTIALIAGIYDRLLTAIKSFDVDVIKLAFRFQVKQVFAKFHWKFLLALVSGVFSAVLFFTKVIPLPLLIHTHPEPIYGLFFGLIVGSIFVILKKIAPLDWLMFLFIAVGAVIGFVTVNLVPIETPSELPFIFLYGMVAIIAMILPGISGSFILLILRKYDYIFGQIGLVGSEQTVDAFIILAVFGLGCITGITLFSRFLTWLLKKYYRPTMAVLIGFLIGTLWVIWPWQIRQFEEAVKRKPVEQNDAAWIILKENPQDTSLPEFERAAELNGQPVIEKVKKKLIASTPIAPTASAGMFPWIAMIYGLAVVLLIEWKAGKSPDVH